MENENCSPCNNSPLDYEGGSSNPYVHSNTPSSSHGMSAITNALRKLQDEKLKDNYYIHYKNLEIQKLEAATKTLNENSLELHEMYLHAKTLTQTDNFLELKGNSLEANIYIRNTLKEKIKKEEQKTEEWKKKYDDAIKLYSSNYDDLVNRRKRHDPLWPKLEQARQEMLRLEVECKMLRQKKGEVKKQENLRQNIHKKMRNASVVEFSKAMVERERLIKLSEEIKSAEQEEAELVKELERLEVIAASKKLEDQLKVLHNENLTLNMQQSHLQLSSFQKSSSFNFLADPRITHERRMKEIEHQQQQQRPLKRLPTLSYNKFSSPPKQKKRVNILRSEIIARGRVKESNAEEKNLNQMEFVSGINFKENIQLPAKPENQEVKLDVEESKRTYLPLNTLSLNKPLSSEVKTSNLLQVPSSRSTFLAHQKQHQAQGVIPKPKKRFASSNRGNRSPSPKKYNMLGAISSTQIFKDRNAANLNEVDSFVQSNLTSKIVVPQTPEKNTVEQEEYEFSQLSNADDVIPLSRAFEKTAPEGMFSKIPTPSKRPGFLQLGLDRKKEVNVSYQDYTDDPTVGDIDETGSDGSPACSVALSSNRSNEDPSENNPLSAPSAPSFMNFGMFKQTSNNDEKRAGFSSFPFKKMF